MGHDSAKTASRARARDWLRSSLEPLLFLPVVAGLTLSWERGNEWSSSGWDTAAGRSLALLTFLAAWVYVVHVAGGLSRMWHLLALSVLALSAVGIPAAFYAFEVGRRDPGLVDGFYAVRPGMGLAVTFVGGLALAVHVVFEWRRRRTASQIP